MPDLDLIKQEEQERATGMGGPPGAGRAIPPGATGCRDHVNRAARLLLAREGEGLTRKTVEMAPAGDPAALRLCVERIVEPYRERAFEFTMPPIREGGLPALPRTFLKTPGPSSRNALERMRPIPPCGAMGSARSVARC